MDLVTRFRANCPEGLPDECWPWRGTIRRKGYGQMSVAGRTRLAHRLAYELAVGPIPDGLQVCHRCDNPPCCNPAHLFLGTAADNQHDKGAKGRAARGSANGGGGKLTEDQVRTIKARLARGDTPVALSHAYGVSAAMIRYIRSGKKWGHL